MRTFLAMDFSRAGAVEALAGAFRARVQWKQDGGLREAPGPRRRTREAAEEDLESMRAAASGMSREDGLAAMKVEADALKSGKPPKEVGYIDRDGNGFRAHVEFMEEGARRHIPRPCRPDEEAAKADLVSMRTAASGKSYRRRRVANRHVLAEGYMDKTLVSIPFPNTALAMYLLIGFP